MTVPDDNSIRALIARFHIEVIVGYSEGSDQKVICGYTRNHTFAELINSRSSCAAMVLFTLCISALSSSSKPMYCLTNSTVQISNKPLK